MDISNDIYINNYIYYTNKIIINDKIIPNHKNYIYFCLDLEYNINNPYSYIYLIRHVMNEDILLWVDNKDLVIIPDTKQQLLEILYDCKKDLKKT